MSSALITLAVGIIILLICAKTLVRNSETLAHSLKISPLIIGMTIVAIGTSLPELAVSLIAAAKNDIGLALGNIIGSNIINVFMVLPVGILLGKLRIGTTKTQRNSVLLLFVTLLFLIIYFIDLNPIYKSMILIFSAFTLTYIEILWAQLGKKHEDKKRVESFKHEEFSAGKIIIFILSIVGIILGGFITVNSVELISKITGYSTTLLGLSLTAIATSLPELLTTIFSQEEHEEKLTIGNIMGSNIYNLLFIGGVIFLFSPKTVISAVDWTIFGVSTIIFFAIIRRFSGEKVPRKTGLILFFFLFLYLFLLTQKV